MHVSIFNDGTLIGHADLTELDPPMGVATGRFVPSENYVQIEHANVVDGEYVGTRSDNFRVLSKEHGEIESSALAILDFPTLGEIEFHALGIKRPDYAVLFGDHPHYRAYYDLDLSDEERHAKGEALRKRTRARHVREWLWFLGTVAVLAVAVVWIV